PDAAGQGRRVRGAAPPARWLRFDAGATKRDPTASARGGGSTTGTAGRRVGEYGLWADGGGNPAGRGPSGVTQKPTFGGARVTIRQSAGPSPPFVSIFLAREMLSIL